MTEKVIIYRRYSTDEQGDEARDSFPRQQRTCDAFAASKGWEVIERIDDRGRSAYKNEHIELGELGRLTRRIEAGEIEAGTTILAEKLDRFSRRPIGEAMAWVFTLTSKNIRMAVADSGTVYDANPSLGTFLATAVTAAQGHEESAKKSERILSAKRSLWASAEERTGRWVNLAARPPLWLKRNPTLNGWIVDEVRAQIIRDTYQWSADGLGAQAICRRLNEAGLPPWGVWRKGAAKWGITSIHALLKNPAVEGDFVAESGIFDGKKIIGFYPVIVDADLVARARGAKHQRKKVIGKPSTTISNLFGTLTVCGECGGRAFLTSNHAKGKHYRYLRCEAAREGRGCKNDGYFPLGEFEKTALDLCLDLALDDRFFEATGELRNLKVKKAETEKDLADTREAHARIRTRYEKGDDLMGDRLDELALEIKALQVAVVEITGDIQRASGRVGDIEHLRRVNDIREAAYSDDADEREQARARLQRALRAIVHTVEIEVIDGRKAFTLILMGGMMGVRIDDKGKVIGAVSDALGKPLYDHLSEEHQVELAPLIRRLKALAA